MENPDSWSVVHKAIDAAIREYEAAVSHSIIGLSLVSHIFNKLNDSGFLKKIEDPKPWKIDMGCNLHVDCSKKKPGAPCCHDECCEDCFGY